MKKLFALVLTGIFLLACVSPAVAAGYLANKKSGKYHLATCRTIKRPNAPHFVPFNSAEEARAAGFVPCRVCLK